MIPSIYSFSAYGAPTANPLTGPTNSQLYDIQKARDIKKKIEEAAQASESNYPAFRVFGADMSKAMDKAFPKASNPEHLSERESLEKGLDHLGTYIDTQKKELEKDGRHMYDLTYMGQHEAVTNMQSHLADLKDEMIPPIRVKAVVAPSMRDTSKSGGRKRKSRMSKSLRKKGANRKTIRGRKGKKHRKTKRR